jgi:hypothetical protein
MVKREIVWATNNVTGVLCPVPKDMFEIQHYMWTRAAAPVSQASVKAAPKESPTLDSTVSDEVALVIQTAAGEPFKTEQAAKSAMKTKKLSPEEYMVLSVDGGFIITRK